MNLNQSKRRFMSGLVILAFPMMLVGYVIVSNYGFDFMGLAQDVMSRIRAFSLLIRELSDPIFSLFGTILSWVFFLAFPVCTGTLAHATYMALNTRQRSTAGLAGILTTVSVFILLGVMPDQPLFYYMIGSVLSLFATLNVKTTHNSGFGLFMLLISMVLVFVGLMN